MPFKIRSSGKVRILDLAGEIKLAIGDPSLHEAVEKLLSDGHYHILFNLKDVGFVDTMGLGEMVLARKRARERGGEVKLLSPSSAVMKVLTVTMLIRVFEIFDDEIKALESF